MNRLSCFITGILQLTYGYNVISIGTSRYINNLTFQRSITNRNRIRFCCFTKITQCYRVFCLCICMIS